MRRKSHTISIIAAAAALATAPAAFAQEAIEAAGDGVEVVRDAVALQDDLRPRDIDRDFADTAMVFTNLGNADVRVRCAGYDRNGRPVGRAWLRLPSLGVRYVLASDLSGGADFVGHAQCATWGSVKGTAVFLGPGITDLPVNPIKGIFGRIRFPLVATY